MNHHALVRLAVLSAASLATPGVLYAQGCPSAPPEMGLLENPRNSVVRLCTTAGTIDLEMFDAEAPLTVANFLAYVNSGRLNASFIHRSSFYSPGQPFILQAGGWAYSNSLGLQSVPQYSPIALEVTGRSNLQRTVGMARASNPDSATSQLFFNSVNNTFLDPTGPSNGYAVFGRVIQGWGVVSLIQSTAARDLQSDPAFAGPNQFAFTEVPVTAAYSQPLGVRENALVHITQAQVVSLPTHCSADFDRDGDNGTDADIEAFFACLGGACCATCPADADFDNDGETGTDLDIESFFRVMGGGNC